MLKKTAVFSAVLLMAVSSVSCGASGGKSYDSSSKANSEAQASVSDNDKDADTKSTQQTTFEFDFPESREMFENDFGSAPDIDDGAVISISNTEAEAGGVAEVTVSLQGGEGKWSMCGLHFVHPKELKIQLADEEELTLKCKKGEAVEDNLGFVTRQWRDNQPQELIDNNCGCFFFTTVFDSYGGHDGDIATFYFDVPADAESGTVYPIEVYYRTHDMFRNVEQEQSFEKYAYTHWKAGSVTVK